MLQPFGALSVKRATGSNNPTRMEVPGGVGTKPFPRGS